MSADGGFDLDAAIGQLEQEFRLRDTQRSGIIPRSEFSFALVRNGGMLDQIDALAQQFSSPSVPGGVNYIAFMQHMRSLASAPPQDDLLPSPPPAVDSRPRFAEVASPPAAPSVPSQLGLRDFVPSPEFFERVSGVAAEVSRRSASPPQQAPLFSFPLEQAKGAAQVNVSQLPVRLPAAAQYPTDPMVNQRQPPPQPVQQRTPATHHADPVNVSRSGSSAGEGQTGKTSLRVVFGVVDEDGDDVVSSDDIGIAFALHGVRTPQEQIDALFDAFETPAINYTDFCTLVSRLPPDAIQRIRSATTWGNHAPRTPQPAEAQRRPIEGTPQHGPPNPPPASPGAPGAVQAPLSKAALSPGEWRGPPRQASSAKLRFELPTQSSHAKRLDTVTSNSSKPSATVREPNRAISPAARKAGGAPSCASRLPTGKPQPAVHKVSLVQPAPAPAPKALTQPDGASHAEQLFQSATSPPAALRTAAPVPCPPQDEPAVPRETVRKFGGNASHLLSLCTNMDKRQSGVLEVARLQIALRAVAPSLSSSEVAALCEMSLASETSAACDYVKLAGDLIIAEAELRNCSSPQQCRQPSPQRAEMGVEALSSRPMNVAPLHAEKAPVFVSAASKAQRDDSTRSSSRSRSQMSADDAELSLEERVRRGREKMRLLIRQELLAAVQNDDHLLLEYFARVDPSQSGYADEKAFRRTLVDMFKAGQRLLSPWVMDRCVKTSRTPFEPSHSSVAEMSAAEVSARNTARRCPAKLQSTMCDYRFLLADLGFVDY
jgi:Ca2+-binding EF-hand superfamily protein